MPFPVLLHHLLAKDLFRFKFEDNKGHQSNLLGLVKTVTKMVTGCLQTMKSCHICIRGLKFVLVGYENVGLCLYMLEQLRPLGSIFEKEFKLNIFFAKNLDKKL